MVSVTHEPGVSSHGDRQTDTSESNCKIEFYDTCNLDRYTNKRQPSH